MPNKVKTSKGFPRVFLKVAAALYEGEEEIEITLSDKNKASAFRMDFYAWRAALKREGSPYFHLANVVVVRKGDAPGSLLFGNGATNAGTEALESALRERGLERITIPPEDSLPPVEVSEPLSTDPEPDFDTLLDGLNEESP